MNLIQRIYSKYICFFLILLLVLPYRAHSTTLDEVTVGPYLGQHKTLESALTAISDGGIINIVYKPDTYIFDSIVIDKNITIRGISNSSGSLPTVYFKSEDTPPIQVNSPNYLVIENINLEASHGESLMESYTPNLTMSNITTRHCIPLVLKDPIDNEQMEILIQDSNFNTFTPIVELSSGVRGNITLNNNTFSDVSLFITNYGANINLTNNVFDSSGIKILSSSNGPVNISGNIFIGNTCKVDSSSSSDLNIYNNKFLAINSYIINRDTDNTLVLNYNWWGSINGPQGSSNEFDFQGAIDYDNWALDESFSSYRLPYDIKGTAMLKNSYSHKDIRVDLIHDNEVMSTYFTDIEGNFSFSDVYTGNYTLTFIYDKYNTVSEEVYLVSEDATVNVELKYNIGRFDFNGDDEFNEHDVELIVENFGQSVESPFWNKVYDINNNGEIDILDLIIALRFRGEF